MKLCSFFDPFPTLTKKNSSLHNQRELIILTKLSFLVTLFESLKVWCFLFQNVYLCVWMHFCFCASPTKTDLVNKVFSRIMERVIEWKEYWSKAIIFSSMKFWILCFVVWNNHVIYEGREHFTFFTEEIFKSYKTYIIYIF